VVPKPIFLGSKLYIGLGLDSRSPKVFLNLFRGICLIHLGDFFKYIMELVGVRLGYPNNLEWVIPF